MPKLIIQENVPMAPMTTMKIGGPARYFTEVTSEEEILEAVKFAKEKNLEIFVLAGGSNILVSDNGFQGLVIRIQNAKYKIQDTKIECGAGVMLSKAVNEAARNSLSGLEWAAGIPGTVGGAIRGNAGAYGSDMSKSVEQVQFLDMSNINESYLVKTQNSKLKTQNYSLKIKVIKNTECEFEYRSSIFKKNKNLIILSAELKLNKGIKEEIDNKMNDIISKRNKNLPCDPSAGSFFQNPVVDDKNLIEQFENDTGCKCRGNTLPAGWLIDEAGLRGKRIGSVMVSEKHANFVINLGGGKAEEIVMLSSFIKQQVRMKFGVQLKEEIEYVGF